MRRNLLIICIFFFVQTTQQRLILNPDFVCPHGCQCITDVVNENLLTITCHWQNIEPDSFYQFPHNKTKTLTIFCKRPENVDEQKNRENEAYLFKNFTELQELKISNCPFKKLSENTFKGMPNLRSLYLNQINSFNLEMDNRVFLYLTNLDKLTIRNSSIQKIPNRSICVLEILKILDLSHNNLGNSRLGIDPMDQCTLKNLIIMDISYNNIKHVASTDFTPFPLLTKLYLANNGLREIEFEAFKPISSIQLIDLSHNQIRELAPLPDSILHLNLAQNRIPVIPATVSNLVSLTTLNMSGNSIDSNTPFSLLSNQLESLDLSNNILSEIPLRIFKESLGNLIVLNLAQNDITQIEPYTFQNFTNLKTLDLSNNQIKSLQTKIFHGLSQLQTLLLNNNSIYHVDVEVFSDMGTRLNTLGMASNMLTEMPVAIAQLSRIKTIDLSNNQISKAYKFVLNKIPLNNLDLRNNKMQNIESYVFFDSTHLVELILRNNQIQNISNDAFEKCPRLKKIDLSENNLTSLHGAIKTIKSLKSLNISSNSLNSLEWNELPEGLNEIFAESNNIFNLTEAKESRTKIIKLRNNKLTAILAEHLPLTLEELDISQNNLTEIPKNLFFEKTQLQSVNVSENALKTVPEDIFDQSVVVNHNIPGLLWMAGNPLLCNCEMSWILNPSEKPVKIADNEIAKCTLPLSQKEEILRNVSADAFLCSYENICEPGCICCKYGSCDCKSKCPKECECYHDQSLKINVVKCNATKNEIDIKNLPMHASHVFLNEVNLPILKSHDFSGRTRLMQIHIISSNLSVIQPLAFNTLPKLRVINLAGNKLQRINGDESFKTEKVEKFNLQQNNLKSIDAGFADIMPNLDELLINDNDLKEIPDYLNNEDALEKLNIISIGNNPLRCDCSRNQRFRTQHWYMENVGKIIDTAHIYCVENVTESLQRNDSTILSFYRPNLGEDLYSIPITDFIQQENKTICVRKTEGIFGGTKKENTFLIVILIIFVLLIFMAVLCLCSTSFRREKKTRNRYIKTNSLNHSSTETPGCSPLPRKLIEYDAFISYSKNDEEEMFQELYRPLQNNDLRLCLLHEDDSEYNGELHSIPQKLYGQLESSHALIILVTKSFVENEWLTTQIKTSHLWFSKLEDKKLIAIISPEIDCNKLDTQLGQILRKNICITRGSHMFWQTLLPKLHRDSPVPSLETQIYSDIYSVVPSELI